MVEVIPKVKLRLTRDESHAVGEFLPLWLLICDARIKNSQRHEIENHVMSWQVFKCIIQQLKKQFDKRSQGTAKNHVYSFTPAESIVFIQFLLKHPIAADNIWLFMLRQSIINTLHPQN